ncbi:MAG: HAD family phosphatase [Bacteroidetes bacterium]|nr:HAD family phosphatase [Bacteroidota bacterium]
MKNFNNLPLALIFDMDGVLIDSRAFHLEAWVMFCNRYGISMTAEEFNKNMFGGSNRDLMEKVFGRNLTDAEIEMYATEKEVLYRELHGPSIHALSGVKKFIRIARAAGIKTAVATAAPRENLDFTLDMTEMRDFFDVITDDSQVKKAKPDPEVYLKTADLLNMKVENCLVFEDSLTGIAAAQAAGMRVIGVSTSLSKMELSHTWKVIHDFSTLTLSDIKY